MSSGAQRFTLILWRLAILSVILYAISGPLRGVTGVGWIPNFSLIAAVSVAFVYLIFMRTLAASRTTLWAGILLGGLILIHVIMNNFYPYTTWSTLDIVDKFYPTLVVFWLPILLVGTGSGGRWCSRFILNGHLLATVGISVLILLVGFQVISNPLDIPLGARLGIPFERNTYPINSHIIYLTYVVPAGIYAFAGMIHDEHRRVFGLIFSLIVATTLLTQIRKVYLALFGGLVLYALFDRRTREIMVKFLVMGSPLIVLGLYYTHQIAPESTIARINQFTTAISFAIRYPLGAGHSSVEILVGSEGPHNIFLNALTEFGLVAFAILIAIITLLFLRAIRVGTHSRAFIPMCLSASLIGMLIGLQFEAPYHLQRFWFIIGLFLAAGDSDIGPKWNSGPVVTPDPQSNPPPESER